MGVSVREAERWLNAQLFLNEYPQWDIEGPHCPLILHSMFLHAAGEGQKEVERFIHQGHQQSLPRPDPEESLSAIWLVGYWTSWKEIQDLYHEVYLLRRSPGLLPCRPWLGEEAIQDILSSLMSQLERQGGATLQEDQYGSAAATYQPFSQSEGQSWSHERRS